MPTPPEHSTPEKGPFLRQVNPGQRVTGYYRVRDKQLEPFRDATRGRFLTVVLSDKSGEMLARVWENAENLAEKFDVGDVVKVIADVELYQNRPQMVIQRLREAQANEYRVDDFVRTAARPIAEMVQDLQSQLDNVENPFLAQLLNYFFSDSQLLSAYAHAPAARQVHHAYIGGLLEHVLEISTLAQPLLLLYPEIDRDLLLAGILLHDIGKLQEFRIEPTIEYTNEGKLLGHVVLGLQMVHSAIQEIPDFPDELRLRVEHMIASHHGRYEWGSPRRPKTLEAMALHQLEDLSAQVNRFRDRLLERTDASGEWTDYDRSLGRALYLGADDSLSIEESGQLS
ncbi:MAG TPA: HD domain-containing protein [Anaerolineales bacterium]|nr:HD domain-containing protein [Anaerolineales bacterium]